MKRPITLIGICLILILSIFLFPKLTTFRRSGLYVYNSGKHYGFIIGETKEAVLEKILEKNIDKHFQIKTRQPNILLNKYLVSSEVIIEKLLKSDYWIFSPNWPDLHLFLFKNSKLIRIIEFHRNFGELNGTHHFFDAKVNDINIFEGLSEKETNEIIKRSTEKRVYFGCFR